MKRIILALFFLFGMLLVFAGVPLAESGPTIRFDPAPEETGIIFCDDSYLTDVIATNLVPNPMAIAEPNPVSNIVNGFSVKVNYDPALLNVTINENPFGASATCVSNSGTCAVGPISGVDIVENQVLVSFLITGGGTLTPSDLAMVDFDIADTYLISPDVLFFANSISAPTVQIPTLVGQALALSCDTTAIGNPLNLQGGTPVAKSILYIFAVAALLGISGLVLVFRLRQKVI